MKLSGDRCNSGHDEYILGELERYLTIIRYRKMRLAVNILEVEQILLNRMASDE